MSRKLTTCIALVGALALAGVAGAVQPAQSPQVSTESVGQAKKCKGVMAKVGGKRVCLAVGRPCKEKYERVYERHGYVCRGGTLFKKPPVIPTAQLVATIPVGAGPTSIRYLDGSIWVRNNADGSVSRIDPATNTVVATIRVGDGEGDIAFGDGSIWVASSEPATVSRIDATSNTVIATIPTGGQGTWGSPRHQAQSGRRTTGTARRRSPPSSGSTRRRIASSGRVVWALPASTVRAGRS